MSRSTAALLVLSLAVLTVLLGACGGDGSTTPSQTTSGNGRDVEFQSTGEPTLDNMARNALLADNIELAKLTGYQKTPCGVNPDDPLGAPPECRPTEPPGTQVDIFPVLGCDKAWTRPEQLPDVYAASIGGHDTTLYAAYQPRALSGAFQPDYILVFKRKTDHDNGASAGFALHVRQGRIVSLEGDCGDLTRLVAGDRVDNFLVKPPEGAARSTSASPSP